MMNAADPMEFFVPSGVDAHLQFYQLFSPTILADSSGVQVSQSFASQFGYQMDTDGSLEDLFPRHDSIGPAEVLASSHSPHGSQDQSYASQEGYTSPKKVNDIVMGDIYYSAPSVFLPTSLTREVTGSSTSPSSTLEHEYVPEIDTYDDLPPPVAVATTQPVLLHPSLRRIEPPARTSPQSESSGEPEIYELEDQSESEPEVVEVAPPPKKRKRTTDASTSSEHPAKRTRLPRGTKTSANKKLKISPSPPPKPPRPQLPTPPPKRKPRTPSPPKEKPHPSSKPGYPYWGAEHSANPPPLVSTPIERREIGLHTLVDPPNGERPAYNYITLIRHAILGSPDKRLTIDGIYEQIMGRFEYYRDQNGKCDKGWKNSVRHQMSLSACFEKKERLIWESGKGVWWVVNESVEGGTKRERKRNRPTKAEKLANPELYPPKPKAVTLPITASPPPQPPMPDATEHPLFPMELPPSLTAAIATLPRSDVSTPQPQLPQQQQHLESRSSLAWVEPMVPASYIPSVAPPRTSLPTAPTSGMGLTHPSLEGSLKPVAAATTISSLHPSFHSTLPSTSIIPSSRSITSNRTSFGSSRDKQGAGSMRGVIHTRWQSSVDLPFDATPRETRANDTSDSEDDDA